MVRKPQEEWSPPKVTWLTRLLSVFDFSMQVVLGVGVVMLLSVVVYLVMRDRFQTVDYILMALRA